MTGEGGKCYHTIGLLNTLSLYVEKGIVFLKEI